MKTIEFIVKIDGKEVKPMKKDGAWLTHNMIQTLCHLSTEFKDLYKKWENVDRSMSAVDAQITDLKLEIFLRKLVNNGQW